MNKLVTLSVEAKVFDDGMLGIKMPVDLSPGTYHAVVVIQPAQPAPVVSASGGNEPIEPLATYLERTRKAYVQRALDACGGNRTQAAHVLGVDPRTVFRFLAEEP